MKKIGWAVFSGFLFTASFPESGHGIFAWVAMVPLMISIDNLSRFDAFRIGFLTGLVHYVSLLYWFIPFLKTYGPFPIYLSITILLLLAAYLALYVALFSMILVWLCSSVISFFCFAPMIWVSLEYVRTFLFTGFPWELLGYSQYNALHIIQISDILCVYGVSAFIALTNAAFFLWGLFFTKRRWQGHKISKQHLQVITAVCVMVWAMVCGYGAWRMHAMDQRIARSPKKRIAVIQGNIDQTLKWDAAHQLSTIHKYLNLSLAQPAEGSDLIVWPETAMPFYLYHQKVLTDMVIGGIQTAGTDFLVSSPAVSQTGTRIQYFNRAYLIRADGTLQDTYDKAHLVPFGEYVPLKKWLPFLGKMVEQVGDFSSGDAGDILAWDQHRIGMLICYELIFPSLSRAAVRNGADLFVNITNDAWYGRSSAPYQHFSMAVFRAVENRRALVRSANTGVSGFIDPVGRIMSASAIFEEAALTNEVPLLNISTAYARAGDVFARACFILVIALMIRRCQTRRK